MKAVYFYNRGEFVQNGIADWTNYETMISTAKDIQKVLEGGYDYKTLENIQETLDKVIRYYDGFENDESIDVKTSAGCYSANLGRLEDMGAAGGNHDGQFRLPPCGGTQAETAGRVDLLHLHDEVNIGIVLARVAQRDVEVVGGFRDVEHHLRRQDGLSGTHRDSDLLGTEGAQRQENKK